MYREKSWSEGFYLDNLEKYECLNCRQEFIIGRNILKAAKRKTAICPYCGSNMTDSSVYLDDHEMEELADDLGCLAIGYRSKHIEEVRFLFNTGLVLQNV